ncbi:MAG TPA: glucose-6-phosphate dehydrogenase [Terriglobales bacterium]|nr:glucose-6-phosphate dehydrogenase [Terriglobales bacterium]
MSTIVQPSVIGKATVPPLPQADSCLLIIFGASGDLTKRKLVPALYDLACAGCMAPDFEVLGVSRTQMTSDAFRTAMHESAMKAKDTRAFTDTCWGEFANRLHYMPGDINDRGFYSKLKQKLDEMTKNGSSANYLFYVSTPASLAGPIVEGLGSVHLNYREKGWSRIVLEKPFGRDLASARELNCTVSKVFQEKDVYRIDHYLGKETVQNMLVFRFGNSIFEPVWNRNYINYVEITAAEPLGVENRASFYEETGALRDMMANHLLQLLTLTAMEPPVAFDADSVREQKVSVLRSIHPMTIEQVARRTVRGQYGAGAINGQPVVGYRDEPGVDPQSLTETFAAVEFYVNNWRWAGVPFFIRTGKRLPRHVTEIRVHFKRTPQALFASTSDEQIEHNVVTMRIQPDEGIAMRFAAKRPGTQMKTIPVQMDFLYREAFGADTPVAYETLLLDAMRGDATLFTRRDEVEAEWKIITPIEEAWAELPAPGFPNYSSGSEGPAQSHLLISGDHRHWHTLMR